MKRTEHFFKLFAHYWNLYTRTGGMEPLERLAYADKTFDALLAWECGVDVPPEELTPFARALIDKRLADGKARADRFRKSPTAALQDTYRNPTGCQQRPYRNPTEALQGTSREPTGNQQGTEIEREKEHWCFQPQQAISNQPNPTQPNARANAGETGPTSPPPVEAVAVEAAGADCQPNAPHGPQDARREPQAADPSPRPSPLPPPRTEAQGAAPVGGIAGTVRTVLQSVVAGGGENKPAGSAMKQFLSTPKEAVWQLPESLLPEAAARYTGSKDAGKSTATFTRQMARVGAMPFRRELARWIGECEAGGNGGLRNPTGAFFERVNKAAEVPA